MLNRDDFNAYCASLTATTNVVQWGNASVWKVGGKIFAIYSTWTNKGEPDEERVSFKCSDTSFEILSEQDGLAPAPYLARAKWIQARPGSVLSDEDIEAYVSEAHRILAATLTKTKQREFGLAP